MIPAQFTKFLEQFNGLTDSQLRQVEKRLEDNDEVTNIVKQLEHRMVDSPECPHCHSSLINRHGKTDNMQRYRCKNCNKPQSCLSNGTKCLFQDQIFRPKTSDLNKEQA
jgi:transposase-like protein